MFADVLFPPQSARSTFALPLLGWDASGTLSASSANSLAHPRSVAGVSTSSTSSQQCGTAIHRSVQQWRKVRSRSFFSVQPLMSLVPCSRPRTGSHPHDGEGADRQGEARAALTTPTPFLSFSPVPSPPLPSSSRRRLCTPMIPSHSPLHTDPAFVLSLSIAFVT